MFKWLNKLLGIEYEEKESLGIVRITKSSQQGLLERNHSNDAYNKACKCPECGNTQQNVNSRHGIVVFPMRRSGYGVWHGKCKQCKCEWEVTYQN